MNNVILKGYQRSQSLESTEKQALMASKNYGIVSSHFSGKSQNCFSIEDVEALSARSATFAKVLKRIVYGTRFTVTRSRRTNIANVVYTKISLLGFNAAARDGDCNRVRVEENLGRRQRQRWVAAKTTTIRNIPLDSHVTPAVASLVSRGRSTLGCIITA